jgi:peptidoglycan/xylan/chitin deacetylase (PgdA/CDA1 family)
MPPEKEKAYIKKEIETIARICGEPPKGWYYGRLSSRSQALVWEVYKEMGVPLLWDSDSYADDLPYWVDVPAEKGEGKPAGMLMIPYSYGLFCSVLFSSVTLPYSNSPQTAMTSNSTSQPVSIRSLISMTTLKEPLMPYTKKARKDHRR